MGICLKVVNVIGWLEFELTTISQSNTLDITLQKLPLFIFLLYIYILGQKYKTTLKNEEKDIVYNY